MTISHPPRTFQFSVRGLLLFMTCCAMFLAAQRLFGLPGMAVLATLIGIVWVCFEPKHRYPWRPLLLLVLGVMGCVLLAIISWLIGQGPVLFRADWPPAVNRMVDSIQADPGRVRVHSVTQFMFHSRYVWRIADVPPDRFAPLAEGLDLLPATPELLPAKFWEGFPGWWRPRCDPGCQAFVTPDFRNEGIQYVLLYQPDTRRLYVRYDVSL